MTLSIPVAIYARYSTDRQDARSIDDQMRRCRAFAAERGYSVIAEYKDAAMSGAHLQRADMQRMLAAAQKDGRPPFKAVLVDDLSRLSRDLGNTWRIVFEDLASVDVKVVDVATGLASDGAGARLTFGAMALVNDTFLQLVRTETHRGLQGRALAGFWTGGRVYGYTTLEEENPPDPEHRRKRPVIDEKEAEVVRRIFRLFAEGMAFRKIAHLLNDEGIPAPHDGGKGHKIGQGWGHTTVRAMLENERYLGRFVWNQSKWVRVPGKKSRRRVMRPESEHVVADYPELAIISRELWDAVKARFVREPALKRRGRPAGSGETPYLVSGLLRCGACGASMSIRSKRVKNGVTYTSFGCTSYYSRGAAICSNNMTVSERKASEAIIGALQGLTADDRVADAFRGWFDERLGERNASVEGDHADLDKRIRDSELRLKNVTGALARVGWSEALGAELKAEEQRLAQLRAERAQAYSRGTLVAAPDPKEIAGFLRGLVGLLEVDPAKGREFLVRHLAPVVMTPEGEGDARHYRATSAFDISVAIRKDSGPPSDGRPESMKNAVAGARFELATFGL